MRSHYDALARCTSNLNSRSDGRLARTIGRSGEGPGEFNPSPITLSFVGDTLWVGDWSRAQAFGPLGQPLDFARFQVYVPEEASQYWADSPLRDGSFWSRRSTRINSRHVPDGPGTGLRAIRRFSPEGEVLDTIAMLDGRDRYVEYGPDEFTKHPLWKLLPDTWLIGWRDMLAADRSSIVLLGDVREEPGSASFDLLRIGIWGDTLLMRSVPYEPRPFSRALEAWWRDEFGKFMAGDYTRGLSDWGQRTEPDTREAREKAREGFWLPQYHPPVRRVMAGADETIWVLREMLEPAGPDRWEVYDYDGELIGRFTVSEGRSSFSPMFPHLRIRQATRNVVWGTTMDEFHVPYIHKFTVLNNCE